MKLPDKLLPPNIFTPVCRQDMEAQNLTRTKILWCFSMTNLCIFPLKKIFLYSVNSTKQCPNFNSVLTDLCVIIKLYNIFGVSCFFFCVERTGAVVKLRTEVTGSSPPVAVRCGLE